MLTCFDIGGSRIKPGHSSGPGFVTPLAPRETPQDYAAFVSVIKEGLAPKSRGLSMSVAGVVDPTTGEIRVANIPALNGRKLAEALELSLGQPVWIANDADCFALAEATSGAAIGHRTVFGIILGTGVGGGLVIDKRIVTGAGGFAGEWGHGPVLNTRLADLGLEIPHFPCGCGLSGCVDTVGGARGLERVYEHLFGIKMSSTAILSNWLSGEAAARLVIDAWLELISGPLAMVLNVVGASVVPVGGGLSAVPELVGALDEAVRRKVLRSGNGALLRPAQQRTEPGLIGAMILGWQGLGHG